MLRERFLSLVLLCILGVFGAWLTTVPWLRAGWVLLVAVPVYLIGLWSGLAGLRYPERYGPDRTSNGVIVLSLVSLLGLIWFLFFAL